MSIEQKKNELLEILQDPTAFIIDVPLSLSKFVLELDPTCCSWIAPDSFGLPNHTSTVMCAISFCITSKYLADAHVAGPENTL